MIKNKLSLRKIRDLAETQWLDFRQDNGAVMRWMKWGGIIFAIYLLAMVVLGVIWTFEPDRFNVVERVEQEFPGRDVHQITGVYTTTTLIHVADTMLNKSGGYFYNDVLPPGIWMDNIPHWEYGVLIQIRDFTKAMREAYSRSQSQSTEDEDLIVAESRFNFDHDAWGFGLIPHTEGEYEEGIRYLRSYLERLADDDAQDAQFFARADNLRYWLSTVETRLGSLSQRLSASVGQRRVNTDLAGDTAASQSTATPSEVVVKTPWHEVDDVFFEARGSAWAISHFLRAIEKDFGPVLEKKNARVSLQQIIRELEAAQQSISSPVILNGSGFGLFANHSLVMASYLSRANAALIDLRDLLSQG